LLHIFEQKTDENQPAERAQLVELLEQQGILAERKSIYSDIDTLLRAGLRHPAAARARRRLLDGQPCLQAFRS